MIRRLSLAGLSTVVVLLAAACGGGGTATLGASDVAVVGDQEVTKADLTSLMSRAKKSYQAAKRPFPKPGTQAFNTLQGQAVTFLVQRAEFAQKAADIGIHVSDKDVDARINQVKTQIYKGNEKKYEAALRQQGVTPDQARDEVKTQLLSEQLYKKVTGDVQVSDKDIQNYYNSNKAMYRQKESRDVRHILVPTRTLADKLHAQLVASHEKNFATLAKKYSKDPGSAANGGKLTVVRGQTVPAFDKTAFSLKTGALSMPVHTQYGWHIIQALSAIKPPVVTPLSKVKAAIRQQLEQQKKNEAMTKWVDDAKKEFCKPGKVKYQTGYTPNPDPCIAVTSSTTTTK